MDNPGWLLRFQGPVAQKPLVVGFSRSNFDWIEVQVTEGELLMYSGPVNLNETIWRILQAADLETGPPPLVPPVPLYFHNYGSNDTLDLATRLTRWFLSMCNYDWEHGEGITISTTPSGGWQLLVDTDDESSLSSEDLAVLSWSGSGAVSTFKKVGTILSAECEAAQLPSMLSQCLEWLEGDGRKNDDGR